MRLLFFAGSAREGSHNKKLARLGQMIAEANGIEAVFADLCDYHMPIYHAIWKTPRACRNGPKPSRRFSVSMTAL